MLYAHAKMLILPESALRQLAATYASAMCKARGCCAHAVPAYAQLSPTPLLARAYAGLRDVECCLLLLPPMRCSLPLMAELMRHDAMSLPVDTCCFASRHASATDTRYGFLRSADMLMPRCRCYAIAVFADFLFSRLSARRRRLLRATFDDTYGPRSWRFSLPVPIATPLRFHFLHFIYLTGYACYIFLRRFFACFTAIGLPSV